MESFDRGRLPAYTAGYWIQNWRPEPPHETGSERRVNLDAASVSYRSLKDLVLERLRALILNGELRPGDWLKQDALAESLGVSRLPVRDAINTLRAEGLVASDTKRHAIVAAPNFAELISVYQIRELLEPAALRVTVPLMSKDDLLHYGRLAKRLGELGRSGDHVAWIEVDRDLHLHSYHRHPNARLLKIIRGLWDESQHFRRMYISASSTLETAADLHDRLLEAFRRRDATLAAELQAEHIRETLTLLTTKGERE